MLLPFSTNERGSGMDAAMWGVVTGYLVTAAGLVATLWQKQVAETRDRRERAVLDARSTWWSRFEWAVGLLRSDSLVSQGIGMKVINSLLRSPLATDSEWGLIEALAVESTWVDNEEDQEDQR